jgi:hypothetical protein
MVPSSEEVEGFGQRLTALRAVIEQRGNVELRANSPVLPKLAQLAKDWIMLSQRLKPAGIVAAATLGDCDQHMGELLGARGQGRRSPYYLTRLRAVEKRFTAEVVIPVVQHAGDLRQVAVRQLRTDLAPHLTTREQVYAEEALKCVGESCNRAAIVLLWASAVTRMHNSIEYGLGFAALNTALTNIGARRAYPYNVVRERGPVGTTAELQRVPDFAMLVAGMELWKYDGQAFTELAATLQTRNNAAHPGMGTPRLIDVQHFTSKLIDFVFSKIPK